MPITAPATAPPLEIRVGLPRPGGALAAAARALGYSVMVSANSFVVRDQYGDPLRVRAPGPDFAGIDAALDSGGFVGMAHYADLPLPTEAYVHRVATAYPWAWYAQPDYCCEPNVAGSRSAVRLRQAATAALFAECSAIAARAGLQAPVPVLQGWTPEDYHRSWELLPLLDTPPLVGVGSVCRRPVHGPTGLMAVVQRIDQVLPRGVQLHLFGVKSAGIRALLAEGALDGRVRSVDSMAWDFAARARFRTGRTIARRIAAMKAWHDRQAEAAAGAYATAQSSLCAGTLRALPGSPAPEDPALEEIAGLVAAGEADLRTGIGLYEDAVLSRDTRTPAGTARLRRPAAPPDAVQPELPLAA